MLMIPINKPIVDYGYYIVYSGYPPNQQIELDEAGGLGKSGFKSLNEALEDVKSNDLIGDLEDTVLFYGINSVGYLVVLPPFGYMSGEDFLQSS